MESEREKTHTTVVVRGEEFRSALGKTFFLAAGHNVVVIFCVACVSRCSRLRPSCDPLFVKPFPCHLNLRKSKAGEIDEETLNLY